jgi:hypothetical protein
MQIVIYHKYLKKKVKENVRLENYFSILHIILKIKKTIIIILIIFL